MYVIEVIPLVRGSQIESLTYYSTVKYDIGTILKVPIRQKEVPALVTDHQPVSAAKSTLRRATFTLKKLAEQPQAQTLPPILIATAKELTKEVPARVGAILHALLPEEVRTGEITLESSLPCIGTYEAPMVSLLQAPQEERIRAYRSRIREAFAHRGSVLFVVPTSTDVRAAEEALSQGIENRLVTLSTAQTVKKRQRSYEAIHDLSHAKLIITTPSHCFLDRHDITHIIIEQCGSTFYKAKTRPYLDRRHVLTTLAKLSGRHIIMGDLLPPTEAEYRRREDVYNTENEHPKRIAFASNLSIITSERESTPDTPFSLFTEQLKQHITDALAKRHRLFIFAARRGLAPVVACVDCGHIFRCPDSGSPYSLLRTHKNGEEQRWFLSTVSGTRIRAADTCPECGSWRLKERGIGIQHVYDELSTFVGKQSIFVFDHTTATTPRKAQTIVGNFYNSKGAILLGTSMVLPHLTEPVHESIIPSLDAARAIPTWQADEEFFRLGLRLREITSDTVLIQTKRDTDSIIEYLKTGQVDQFYTDELALREALQYPPFTHFVHLTMKGQLDTLRTLEEKLNHTLAVWQPRFYSAPHSTAQETTRFGLIRVPNSAWPDAALNKALRQLPPQIRIEINPTKIV